MKLSTKYEPNQYEGMIYDLWEKSGAFAPKGAGEPYTTIMPPPNANANLHIGHALNYSLQDIAVRYQRMQGRATLYLPGADHAGFETQVVYEKHLAKEGKSRFDFTREELYSRVYDFVQGNKNNFEKQLRGLGASVDWSRFTFTLDEKVVKTACQTFKKLWDDKLIYRGERLVNFCTFHGTAFADIEVEYKNETGKMYYIRFPLVPVEGVTDAKDYVLIATTRPETMLGDVAVAIHPEDERFKHLIGRTVRIPLAERQVPVIADQMVDREFGTGAVKITAAHDPNDFEVARSHNLPLLQVITEEGVIGHDAPHQYHGLKVDEARQQVVKELEAANLLEKTEDHEHRVGHCYKCGTVIQPLVRDQWFIDMKKLAAPAIEALRAGKINFYPQQKREQVITYLENVKDWNISRQIAWGIPIPAFQNIDEPDDWVFDERVDSELLEIDGKTYRRDPDVFDTWFSSGQWPYITLGYPDGEDFKRFYPNTLMETGIDILYQWVARMIVLGLYVTGDVPFKDVYLHGMVRSEDGRKMSKSLGNVIDPHEVIASHGSDALRMGIIAGRSAGYSSAYAPGKVDAARNFCNKLWNIARFIEGIVGDDFDKSHKPKLETPADHWILTKLQQSAEKITADLENYRFSEAYETLYHAVWDDFADWYIEASKTRPNHSVLAYGLETILKLAHPFAPFVTETIWQTLKQKSTSLLMTSDWPVIKPGKTEETATFEAIQGLVSEVRALTRALHLSRPNLYYTGSELLKKHGALVKRLGGLQGVSEVRAGRGLRLTKTRENCWLDVSQETIRDYLGKLEEQQTAEALSVERLKARLANKSYVENAPKHLVEETKTQLKESETRLQQINAELANFQTTTEGIETT